MILTSRFKHHLIIYFTAALGFNSAGIAKVASGQTITIDFRFDSTGSNTMNLNLGSAGQTFTIDIFATIKGDATHTDTSQYGLQTSFDRGFSDQSGGGAFTTGGVVSGSFVGLGQFGQSGNTTAPTSIADNGSTSDGITVSTANKDTIIDYGLSASNGLKQSSTIGYVYANSASEAGFATTANGGMQFEVAQFKFTTGTTSSTAGAVSKFWPTQPGATATEAQFTQDHGTTNTILSNTSGANAQFIIGTPLRFVVVPRQTGSATWNRNGNGNYDDMSNWDPNQIPDGAGLVATFGNGTTTTVNAPSVTATVNAAEHVGTLTFNNTNGTSFILGNDGITGHGLTLNNNGAGGNVNSLTGSNSIFSNLVLADNATFNVAAASSVLVSVGSLSESGASRTMTKTGAGTLTIDTPSSYTGATTVSAGTLVTTPTGTISAGPLIVSSTGGVNSLASLNNNQSVSSLSGSITGGGAATVSVSAGNVLTVAQSANTTFAGKISLTGAAATFTKSGNGVLETDGAPNLADSSLISVTGGTLRFNVSSAATVGSGVSATISGAATLELAGSVSAFSSSDSAAHRVNVMNNSTAAAGLLVSGTNQQVGGINGAGNTSVAAIASLTANHIVQTALAIGGAAGSHGLVTIAPSGPTGNPLDQTSGFALAGSLISGDQVGTGSTGSTNLGSAGGANLATLPAEDFAGIGGSLPVPEPSTLLLAHVALFAVLIANLARNDVRRRTV